MNGATPGTVLVLAAAVLLAVVTASVPVNENIYFLVITASRTRVKLGCLGYCLGGTCSSTGIGYKLSNADALFGVNTRIPYASQLSSGLIHGLTYTLVLHPIACGLAGVAFLLGILQHCTGFATAFLTTLVAGLASTVALVATALDFALFTIAKKRVESAGGSASYGIALWLTLASFIVLVCSQCAFCCSCCSGRGGGGGGGRRKKNKDAEDDYHTPHANSYGQQMRMDALEAENDRLKRNAHGGGRTGDLPKFAEYETEHEVPLKHDYDERMPAHSNTHHAMGQAYGGEQHPNQYSAAPQGHNAGYVPGVGPAYGEGYAGRNQQRDSTAYNNVGGFGAHGAGLDQGYGEDAHHESQYATDPYYDPHGPHGPHGQHGQASDYYAAGGAAAAAGALAAGAAGGHRSRQPTMDDYQSTPYRSPSAHGRGEASYAPSVTSGYAQGGPSHLAMPVPQPAQSSAQALGRSVSVAPTEASRDERRMPTQHDEFGLDALQAGAAAAAVGGSASHADEKQQLQRHLEAQDREQEAPGSAHWQEPSGMYYDAETGGQQQQQAQSGPSGSAYDHDPHGEHDGRWTGHSAYSRAGQSGAGGSEWVPSYEMAIGAISQDEENMRRHNGSGADGSRNTTPGPSTAVQGVGGNATADGDWRTAGRRPLPSTPGPSSSAQQGGGGGGSAYPREKF
ncbi:unnamed protein product [Parajaminaea phylloscopi]